MGYLTTEEYLRDEKTREKERGDMHARINKLDDKHDKNYNSLNLTLKTFIESQKPFNETLVGIRADLKEVNSVLIDYVQKTDNISKELEHVQKNQQASIEDRNKFFKTIIMAGLGAGGFIPVLIQVLFK